MINFVTGLKNTLKKINYPLLTTFRFHLEFTIHYIISWITIHNESIIIITNKVKSKLNLIHADIIFQVSVQYSFSLFLLYFFLHI